MTVTVLALVGTACSDVSSSSTAAAGVPDNSDTTLTLAISPWLGSASNVAVAQKLLQDKLGYTVDTKNANEYAQFKSLSNGDIDATLEIWPSGHGADYQNYIASGNGVVDGGELGITGQIGWYVPTYLVEQHPELATWEGLKTDWQLFQTSDSGDMGQILDGDPSYVTFDDTIAKNLGLNLKAKYAGSEEAELTELDTAYQAQKPILMYFWTPHWAHENYDLTQIKLPKVTDACTQIYATGENADAYNCDYPTDPLYKAFNADLQTNAPAAFAFLSAMQWTEADQNAVSHDLYSEMDPADAAQKWIDANPDTWQSWVDAGLAAQSASPAA
ncbi:MAG: glycine betaine ABC transporter substrate-binding protein [Actinomycetota bacterium]